MSNQEKKCPKNNVSLKYSPITLSTIISSITLPFRVGGKTKYLQLPRYIPENKLSRLTHPILA